MKSISCGHQLLACNFVYWLIEMSWRPSRKLHTSDRKRWKELASVLRGTGRLQTKLTILFQASCILDYLGSVQYKELAIRLTYMCMYTSCKGMQVYMVLNCLKCQNSVWRDYSMDLILN